jgi:aspartate/methionine/tyrosine aminotransferase
MGPDRPKTMLEAAKQLLKPSKRSDVPPFIVMDVMAAAAQREAQGAHIIHMEVGQPAAPAPATAIKAAQAALVRGRIGYTETLGIPSLRARIARHYGDAYDLALDPARVVVTTGSSGGFILAFLSLFEHGDRVALANPGYPPYRHILSALGCEPVLIQTSAETRWALSAKALIAAHQRAPLKGVVIASPANPTGTMMDADALMRLIAVAESEGIRVISDEIYHGLDYAFTAETAANASGRAVVINSFSKYFCMTGWRIGWMVVPEELVRPVERLQGNLAICVPTLAQVAAEAAFDGREEMEAVKHGYEENRRILTEGLPKAGLDKFLPADGAFYLYADISRFSDDSLDFAKRMLNEAGVAATPGIDFDPVDGRHFLRFCYAGSTAEMHEAVKRIGGWLDEK